MMLKLLPVPLKVDFDWIRPCFIFNDDKSENFAGNTV